MPDQDDVTPPSAGLDALLGALRQPARPDELAGELDAIVALAGVVSSPEKGPASVPVRSRTAKLAAVAAVAALAVGGMTAAAATVLKGSPEPAKVNLVPGAAPTTTTTSTTTTTATTTTTTTTTAATTTTAPSTTTAPVTAPPCPAGVKNHGDFVSQVAHDTPPGPEHGQIVSAAAHSDCGKGGDAIGTAAATAASGTSPTTAAATRGNNGNHSGNGKGHH
jgi:hypothetical protein